MGNSLLTNTTEESRENQGQMKCVRNPDTADVLAVMVILGRRKREMRKKVK